MNTHEPPSGNVERWEMEPGSAFTALNAEIAECAQPPKVRIIMARHLQKAIILQTSGVRVHTKSSRGCSMKLLAQVFINTKP